jgi:hypothetical protein
MKSIAQTRMNSATSAWFAAACPSLNTSSIAVLACASHVCAAKCAFRASSVSSIDAPFQNL